MDIMKYLTIPFKDRGRDHSGVDCFGLVQMIYKQEFKIQLPSYIEAYENEKDREAICNEINKEKKLSGWVETDNPKHGNLIILNLLGRPLHLGVMLDHKSFIHCMKGKGTIIEKTTDIIWRNRINGYLKWQI